jgi:hypothetical protein
MTQETYFDLSAAKSYVSILSTQRSQINTMLEQWKQVEKKNDKNKRAIAKAKKDLPKIEKALAVWEAEEERIIKSEFSAAHLVPKL